MGNCLKSETPAQPISVDGPSGSNQNYQAPEPTTTTTKEVSSNPVLAATPTESEISDMACFGAGCYWGTEKYFTVDFARRRYPESLIRGRVGFMGPKDAKENPTYKEVCEGTTGHVEVFNFTFKGGEEMYEQIVRFFFQFHDPTTLNRQKNDKGTQYASVIYCADDKQLAIATKVRDELQTLISDGKITCFAESTVTTAILRSTVFFPAEEEHQEFLSKNPKGYCNHRVRFSEWP